MTHKSKWFPIDEMLPDQNVPVLVWDGVHMYEGVLMHWEIPPTVMDLDDERYSSTTFYVQIPDTGFMETPILPITHWMPLPEPPK